MPILSSDIRRQKIQVGDVRLCRILRKQASAATGQKRAASCTLAVSLGAGQEARVCITEITDPDQWLTLPVDENGFVEPLTSKEAAKQRGKGETSQLLVEGDIRQCVVLKVEGKLLEVSLRDSKIASAAGSLAMDANDDTSAPAPKRRRQAATRDGTTDDDDDEDDEEEDDEDQF